MVKRNFLFMRKNEKHFFSRGKSAKNKFIGKSCTRVNNRLNPESICYVHIVERPFITCVLFDK